MLCVGTREPIGGGGAGWEVRLRETHAVVEIHLDGMRRRRDGRVRGDGLAKDHAVRGELGRESHYSGKREG